MQTYVGASNIISSLGFTTKENYMNALDYRSGISLVGDSFVSDEPKLAARINQERLKELVLEKGLSGFTTLETILILSILDIKKQVGDKVSFDDCAFIFSTTKGNIDLLQADASIKEEVLLGEMAQRVAGFFGVKDAPVVISNACISGVSAIIVASRLVREGRYRHAIVVGGDLLTRFVVSGFSAFKSLSAKPCKPYDAQRDGLTLGEAGGALLVTCDSQLSCGVVIEGGGITNDANHISGPSRTGDGLCFAMQEAMRESGAKSADISFINAHGTATSFNDEMESKAIHMAGLQDAYVNSFKSYWGHTLGAAGLIEAILCIEELKHGVVLGTLGFETLGVPIPIKVSAAHQYMPVTRCIKTASGFGGCNAAVVLALESVANPIASAQEVKHKTVGNCKISNGVLTLNGEENYSQFEEFPAFIREIFKALDAPNMKFYKMDNLCKLGYVGAEYLLKGKSYSAQEVAIVMSNSSSSLDSDMSHQRLLENEGEANVSPAIFVYTLPNVVMGEICIRHKIQGENTFFVGSCNPAMLEDYASILLKRTGYKAVIVGWCELLFDKYELNLKLIERD